MSESTSLSEFTESLSHTSDQLKGLGRPFEALSTRVIEQQKQFADIGKELTDRVTGLDISVQESIQASPEPYYFVEQNSYLLSTFDTYIEEGAIERLVTAIGKELDKHTYNTRYDLDSLHEGLGILKEYLTINVLTDKPEVEKSKFKKWLENRPVLTTAGNIVATYAFNHFMDWLLNH